MRSLVVLLTLLAAAPTAAALGLPALPELSLPALVEFAGEETDAAVLPAPAEAKAEEAVRDAAPPAARPVLRRYVTIDIERRPLAAPEAALEVASGQEAPMLPRIATIQLVPPAGLVGGEPTVEEIAQVGAPGTQAADAEPAPGAPFLLAATLASLAAGMILHGAVAMYHRIAPSQALAHGTRAAVHAEVSRRGAATPGEIAEALDLHPKTARYHLDLLAGFQLLVRDADGAYRAPGVKRATPPTLNEAILELVESRPGLNMAEVARELGVGKSTAQEHVTQLLIDGRLTSRREERSRVLFPRVAVTA